MNFMVGTMILILLGAGEDPPCVASSEPPAVLFDESTAVWPMNLSEAIQTGLTNQEKFCVVSLRRPTPVANCFGPKIEPEQQSVIISEGFPSGRVFLTNHPHCRSERRGSADVISWPSQFPAKAPEPLKAEAEALILRVENCYWILAQKHAELWLQEKNTELLEVIRHREMSILDLQGAGGNPALVTILTQELEQGCAKLATMTRAVLTSEERLRAVLGLPREDNRRILPVTPPSKRAVEASWNAPVVQQLSSKPDVISQRNRFIVAALRFLTVRGVAFVSFLSLGATPQWVRLEFAPTLSAFNDEWSRYADVAHRAAAKLSHSLHEAKSTGQRLASAIHRCDCAKEALDKARESFEAGQLTADEFKEVIAVFQSAFKSRFQLQTDFQDSIVAFEQAKGTLLAYDNITLLGELRNEPESW